MHPSPGERAWMDQQRYAYETGLWDPPVIPPAPEPTEEEVAERLRKRQEAVAEQRRVEALMTGRELTEALLKSRNARWGFGVSSVGVYYRFGRRLPRSFSKYLRVVLATGGYRDRPAEMLLLGHRGAVRQVRVRNVHSSKALWKTVEKWGRNDPLPEFVRKKFAEMAHSPR